MLQLPNGTIVIKGSPRATAIVPCARVGRLPPQNPSEELRLFNELVRLIRHQHRRDTDILLDRSDIAVLLAGIRRLRANIRWKRYRIGHRERRIINAAAEEVITAIAVQHDVPVSQICSPRRTKKVVAARHAAIQAVHDACPKLSTPDIASFFGIDHTTVIYVLNGKRGKSNAARQ